MAEVAAALEVSASKCGPCGGPRAIEMTIFVHGEGAGVSLVVAVEIWISSWVLIHGLFNAYLGFHLVLLGIELGGGQRRCRRLICVWPLLCR